MAICPLSNQRRKPVCPLKQAELINWHGTRSGARDLSTSVKNCLLVMGVLLQSSKKHATVFQMSVFCHICKHNLSFTSAQD